MGWRRYNNFIAQKDVIFVPAYEKNKENSAHKKNKKKKPKSSQKKYITRKELVLKKNTKDCKKVSTAGSRTRNSK